MSALGRLVVYSTRLGSPSAAERALLDIEGVELREVSLRTEAEITTAAAEADVVMVGAVEPVTAGVLESLPRCTGVVRRGVGHDNVDVAAATRLGIVVANVPDASVEEVSDHALALALALVRRVADLDRAVKDGTWVTAPAQLQARRVGIKRLSELTLGVVGAGRIGLAMVRKSRGVFGRVIASDPVVPPEAILAAGAEYVDLDALFRQADVISLHAPLLPSTEHMVNQQSIGLMRPGAIMVNTSRGQLVDQDALVEALATGHIGGAGLDVTDPEPLPANHPLLRFGNVLATGHSAATSDTSAAELRRRSAEAAAAIVTGGIPASVVNPAVLVSPALRLQRSAGTRA